MSTCIFCESGALRRLLSMGELPLANSFLTKAELRRPEPRYPLDLYICEDCKLVQTGRVVSSEAVYDHHAYYASYSDSWLDHAERYVEMVTRRFDLGRASFVLEIASNDGYLLQYMRERNIYAMGIEPAANLAQAARAKGVDTRTAYWNRETAEEIAEEGRLPDLIIANNVLAHVPNLNEFVASMKGVLKPGGVITMEFPHLYRLMEGVQFDTIHHEHLCHFACFVVSKILMLHGLTLFDVEELPTHGGSLRVFACHENDESKEISPRVGALIAREAEAGMMDYDHYDGFARRVHALKNEILRFLIRARESGKTVVGYGAPSKGNTLLNYCEIKPDRIAYTVDRNPHKQGLYLPGSRLPILPQEQILEDRPDYVFILPWNLKDEIMEQLAYIRSWGGQFVVPIPHVHVL